VTEQGVSVSIVGGAEAAQEGFGSVQEALWIDEFLRNLVEVAAHAFDGSPLRGPLAKVAPIVLRPDNRLEMLEDEKKLGQFIERLVIVAERSVVAVRGEEMIAQTM